MEILVYYVLKNSETNDEINKKLSGTLENNIITYQDGDVLVEVEINENLTLIRSTDNYEIKLPFNLNKKTFGSYSLKKYKQRLDIEVTTKKLKIEENHIRVQYELNTQEGIFDFKLDYEVL